MDLMRLRPLRKRFIVLGVFSTVIALGIAAVVYQFHDDENYSASGFPEPKPDKCAYRPNLDIINDSSKLTYGSLAESSFKYRETLQNDYSYYINREQPPPSGGEFLISNNVLVQYISKVHREIAQHAILLVHGNSSMPDGFFSDTGSYLNGAARYLYDEGFDVFAPYATHNSRFQVSRRRLASMSGDHPKELDVKRILQLVEHISSRYEYIHLAGVSNGGGLSALVWDKIRADRPTLADRIGVVLSIEGFHPAEKWFKSDPDTSLFSWNWEMVFPGVLLRDFIRVSAMKNVFLALGSCLQDTYEVFYEDILHDERSVIRYDGAHEFKPDVFMTAFRRWKAESAMP